LKQAISEATVDDAVAEIMRQLQVYICVFFYYIKLLCYLLTYI